MPALNKIVDSVGISFGCVRMLIGAFSVVYMLSKGVSLYQLGWIKAFQGVILVFVDIPLSHLSDKYSRKLSIILSIFFASVWLFLMGVGHTFTHFMIAEFFNALSLGLMSGTFSAYLYDIKKQLMNHYQQ